MIERIEYVGSNKKDEMELSQRNFQKDGNLRLRNFENLGKRKFVNYHNNFFKLSLWRFSFIIIITNTKNGRLIYMYFDHEYMQIGWNKFQHL